MSIERVAARFACCLSWLWGGAIATQYLKRSEVMVDASAAAAAAPPEAPAEQGAVVQGEAVTEAEEAVKVEEVKPAVKGVDRFAWRTEPCVMGIDEAGRGPVLGAMVYGGAVCPLDGGEEALRRVGFMDSKVLKEAVRERLYERMCGDAADLKCYAFVDEISPERLSAQMLSRARVSLNKISHESAMGLVQRALDEGYNVTELIVDTVGDAGRYTDILKVLSFRLWGCPRACSNSTPPD